MYRAVEPTLVRAAVHRADTSFPPYPNVTSHPIDLVSCHDWLTEVWANRSYADAIALASPEMSDEVRRVCEGRRRDPRRMRRTVLSLAKYLLRMTGRSTPYGLFAGVAPATFGPQVVVRWGTRPRAVARADSVWLARRRAFRHWLHIYNHHRPHTALAGRPPASRVTNLSGQYT